MGMLGVPICPRGPCGCRVGWPPSWSMRMLGCLPNAWAVISLSHAQMRGPGWGVLPQRVPSLHSSWQGGQGEGPGSLAGSRRRGRHFLELRVCLQALSWAISPLTPSSRTRLQLPIHRATHCPRERFPEQSLHGIPLWGARGGGKGHGALSPPVLPLPGTPGHTHEPSSRVQAPRGGAGTGFGGLPGGPCRTGGPWGRERWGQEQCLPRSMVIGWGAATAGAVQPLASSQG